MKKKLSFDYSNAMSFIDENDIASVAGVIENAHEMLHKGTGEGSEYTGWLNLPENYDKDEFEAVKESAAKIREDSDILIVIGIGGSYLGAKAAVEMLSIPFYNYLQNSKKKKTGVFFAGNNLSSTYLNGLMDLIDGKDISINVISKSGTTTEPAVAFRIFREYMEKKYGKEEAKKRIYVTTDKASGALKSMADNEGYRCFVIPNNVGGRYSVLTPVGLLPIAVSGFDIGSIMQGANDARIEYMNRDISKNYCYQYAAARNVLYKKGKSIEILANYEPSLDSFSEWWKQLYGESEGKDKKGIFPAAVNYTTDLHSMGQYIQDGMRNIFETVINIEKPASEIEITDNPENMDGLNFLSGKTLDFINKKALQGTVIAHVDGGVPNLMLNVPEISPYYFGYMVYFFEKACGISGYVLGVNPFNQPGVEEYKKNMFALLGKKGYEKRRQELENRIR